MSERQIGKIISVDNFKVIVQLDDNLKSLYKSGLNDIYEIARINSYLIIPVGADRIVAIVTRVKIQDETEIEKSSGHITLPKAQRYLVGTMLGTIENGEQYLQGIYNYPILDNPVWYVVKDELDKIFDRVDAKDYDYTKDYYLPVGTSPSFPDYKIRINPDKFFAKHAAILGNTGSGKSCTVASILQSLFSYEFKGKQKLQSANFIIFDINGEYKRALIGDGDKHIYENKTLVNALCIDKEGLKVPYWFMNFDDFDYLFQPSANTQTPILKKAIGFAKNRTGATSNKTMPTIFLSWINSIIQKAEDVPNYWKLQSDNINSKIAEINALDLGDFDKTALLGYLTTIGSLVPAPKTYTVPDLTVLTPAIEGLKQEIQTYYSIINDKEVELDRSIDLPIWFDYNKLNSEFFDEAIFQEESSSNRIREFVSTLRLRLKSYSNDQRIASPLLLDKNDNIEGSLHLFLSYILGDMFKIYEETNAELYFQNIIGGNLKQMSK